jgi:hypothetical protein
MSRIVSLVVALGVVMPMLAGCADFDPDSLDPFGLNKEKPLPGKRELVFPEGVPGVSQGIPPQYTAGYQSPGSQDLTFDGADGRSSAPAAQTATRAPSTPVRQSNLGKPLQVHKPAAKPKAKPKPKPRRTVKPKAKPKPKPTETASKPKATESPWPSATQQKTTEQGTSAPWPSASTQQRKQETKAGWPGGQQQDEQKLAPWPSAPPSGTFSKQ